MQECRKIIVIFVDYQFVNMPDKIIDLAHLLNENITVYPETLGPKFETLSTVEKHGYAELKMTMVLHSGTHIDAPCHIFRSARSIDSFPVEKFMGSATVIPCLGEKEISLEFLQKFEDRIARADFILFFTGWQFKWKTTEYFDDCPVPTREAAEWLTGFKLKGIGCDSFSVDKIVPAARVTFENLPNHHIFLEKEILLIENLTNLDQLPGGPFSFQSIPLKIENADGSPVRPLAFVS